MMDFYTTQGRHHLPWRKTKNPYRILVSEVMLQQTQATRVVPKYEAFLKRFPTVEALAEARLGDVLREWQGLGYNRRAKMLHESAKKITIYGNFPHEYKALVQLPGVGEYTAKAVRVFAFNEAEVMIETNIRAAFIHHFFSRTKKKMTDKVLVPYMVQALELNRTNPRKWYAALMDYGAYLKKRMPNPSRKSAHHAKQKPFKGSDREIRGAILRALAVSSYVSRRRLDTLPFEKERIVAQLDALVKEEIVTKSEQRYHLP